MRKKTGSFAAGALLALACVLVLLSFASCARPVEKLADVEELLKEGIKHTPISISPEQVATEPSDSGESPRETGVKTSELPKTSKSVSIYLGQRYVLTRSVNGDDYSVDDPSVAELLQNPATGYYYIRPLKVGTTVVHYNSAVSIVDYGVSVRLSSEYDGSGVKQYEFDAETGNEIDLSQLNAELSSCVVEWAGGDRMDGTYKTTDQSKITFSSSGEFTLRFFKWASATSSYFNRPSAYERDEEHLERDIAYVHLTVKNQSFFSVLLERVRSVPTIVIVLLLVACVAVMFRILYTPKKTSGGHPAQTGPDPRAKKLEEENERLMQKVRWLEKGNADLKEKLEQAKKTGAPADLIREIREEMRRNQEEMRRVQEEQKTVTDRILKNQQDTAKQVGDLKKEIKDNAQDNLQLLWCDNTKKTGMKYLYMKCVRTGIAEMIGKSGLGECKTPFEVFSGMEGSANVLEITDKTGKVARTLASFEDFDEQACNKALNLKAVRDLTGANYYAPMKGEYPEILKKNRFIAEDQGPRKNPYSLQTVLFLLTKGRNLHDAHDSGKNAADGEGQIALRCYLYYIAVGKLFPNTVDPEDPQKRTYFMQMKETKKKVDALKIDYSNADPYPPKQDQ